AFGARELARETTPDGKLVHGRIRIGDSIVMLSDVFPGADSSAPTDVGTSTVTLHVYSRDVDALWNRALGAGARVRMPLENQFWGERYGQLIDPFGHHWSLSMRIPMTRAEKQAKQAAAMEALSHGEHPGDGASSSVGPTGPEAKFDDEGGGQTQGGGGR
ncbi:MAG TPA: VOC family protein, partial [Thermoplasmata archaeon]|nr:VOC family protein [Thermoplasmata archaeon]